MSTYGVTEVRQVWYNSVNNELYDYGVYMHQALISHLTMNPQQALEWLHLGAL